jgi:hypothetical protein
MHDAGAITMDADGTVTVMPSSSETNIMGNAMDQ